MGGVELELLKRVTINDSRLLFSFYSTTPHDPSFIFVLANSEQVIVFRVAS